MIVTDSVSFNTMFYADQYATSDVAQYSTI